jgi:hypothetical protein
MTDERVTGAIETKQKGKPSRMAARTEITAAEESYRSDVSEKKWESEVSCSPAL